MEHQKILNLLNEPSDSKFVARKWSIVNDLPNVNYGVGNEIIYNTEILKFSLYNDAYTLLRSDITVTAAPRTYVSFKNCALFTKFITKIDSTKIDDVEGLNFVMPIYNLIEYSSNYSKTTGSLWF